MRNNSENLIIIFSLLVFILTGCVNVSIPETTPTFQPTKMVSFDDFVDQSFKQILRRDPENVTALGLSKMLGMKDDQLTDISEEYIHETQALESNIFSKLQGYDRSSLSPLQQRTYDIYSWYLDDLVRGHEYYYSNYLVSLMIDSPDQVLIQLFRDIQPVHDLDSARVYLARLEKIESKISQVITALEKRKAGSVILPRFLIDWVISNQLAITKPEPTKTPFFTALREKMLPLSSITPADQQEVLAEAEAIIKNSVQPAYLDLAKFMEELKGLAPSRIGVGTLPGGEAYYSYTLRHHTSTELGAAEIHQLGLSELEKIHSEMSEIFDQLEYPQDESLPRLYQRVAADGGYYSGDQIFEKYRELIQDASALAAPLFNHFPASDVIVQPDAFGGYYMPPAMDGSRPGVFYATNSGKQPYYAMPTLAYHEAIPGHHTQMALVGELRLPLFQTVASFTGYVEGWALYAERLMAENNAYDQDPYGYLGYLQFSARRAARLVIDTGIHSKGWDFEKAVEFMIENTGMERRECEYEAARMSVWPGQAVSYYIGYLKIMQLRETAMETLGDRFDIREFHDAVLDLGPAPLSVLESVVNDYIKQTSNP